MTIFELTNEIWHFESLCILKTLQPGEAKIPKVQTKQKVSQISLVRRPSSESEASKIPLLLNHDYLEDSGDKRNSLIYYNPTVPLPAFYQPPPQPPDDIGLDFEVAEAASYYNRKPNVSELQVNTYEIVINFSHISHNLT